MRTASALILCLFLPFLAAYSAPGACYTQPSGPPSAVLGQRSSGHIHFCLGLFRTYCFDFDEGRSLYSDAAFPAHVTSDGAYNNPYLPPVEPVVKHALNGNDLSVCAADRCHTVVLSSLPEKVEDLKVEINEEQALLAVGTGNGVRPFDVYDLKTKQRLYTLELDSLIRPMNLRPDYFSTGFAFSRVRFVGPSMFLNHSPCIRSCDWAVLLDARTGRFIASAGTGRDFFTLHTEPVKIKGEEYAFIEGNSARIVFQNVRTGKITRSLDLTPFVPKELQHDASDGWPVNGSSLLFVSPDSFIVVFGNGVPGRIVFFSQQTLQVVHDFRMRPCTGPALPGQKNPPS